MHNQNFIHENHNAVLLHLFINIVLSAPKTSPTLEKPKMRT